MAKKSVSEPSAAEIAAENQENQRQNIEGLRQAAKLVRTAFETTSAPPDAVFRTQDYLGREIFSGDVGLVSTHLATMRALAKRVLGTADDVNHVFDVGDELIDWEDAEETLLAARAEAVSLFGDGVKPEDVLETYRRIYDRWGGGDDLDEDDLD